MILFLVLLTSHAFASLSCSVKSSCTQTEIELFRMNTITNSHAELVSGLGGYANKVCCSDSSGKQLSISTNAGTDKGGIISLAKTTNAHAGKILTYTDNVYLGIADGKISCSYKSSCVSSETCVASLNQDTNSHVGNCAYGPVKICCVSTIIQPKAPDKLFCEVKNVCTTAETEVLRLFSTSDSHAELITGAQNYANKVCCKELGGKKVNVETNPSVIGGKGNFINLFSTTDSHGQIPSQTDYSQKVYMSIEGGDVNCVTGANCNTHDTCVVSFFQNTDSHVGDCTYGPVKVCCSALISTFKTPTCINPTISSSSIISKYSFENTLNDIVGTNNPSSSNLVSLVDGISGKAYQFNGKDELIGGGQNPLSQIIYEGSPGPQFGTGSFSISLWVKGQTSTYSFHPGEPMPIITSLRGIRLVAYRNGPDDGKIIFNIVDPSTIKSVTANSNKKVMDNQWHHLLLVRDSNAKKLRIYVDKILDNEVSYTDVFDVNTQGFRIGTGLGGNYGDVSFNGIIDEIIFANKAINIDEMNCVVSKSCPSGQAYCKSLDRCSTNAECCSDFCLLDNHLTNGKINSDGDCSLYDTTLCQYGCSNKACNPCPDGTRCGINQVCSGGTCGSGCQNGFFNCDNEPGCESSTACCTNDCNSIGLKTCFNGKVKVCGTHDDDPCLDWSSESTCASNLCSGNDCLLCPTGCATLAEKTCDSADPKKLNTCTLVEGCKKNVATTCPHGCLNGVCQECTACAPRCDGNNRFYSCVKNNFDCDVLSSASSPCASGQVCENGACIDKCQGVVCDSVPKCSGLDKMVTTAKCNPQTGACDYGGQINCAFNKKCDTNTGICNNCEGFSKPPVCKGTNLHTYTCDNSDGASIEKITTCPFGCDAESRKCFSQPCTDECQLTQTKCKTQTQYQTCVVDTVRRCNKWNIDPVTCASGQFCRDNACITNNPPQITKPTITPTDAFTNLELTCNPGQVSDPDGDTQLTVSYKWEKGTTLVSATTNTLAGFTKGDAVKCGVTPTDRFGASGTTQWSDAVVIKAICTDFDSDRYGVGDFSGCIHNDKNDCNDNDPAINPGITIDSCDMIDNDCDGEVDENCPRGTSLTWTELYSNNKPTLPVVTVPTERQRLKGPIPLAWSSTDADNDPLNYKVEYLEGTKSNNILGDALLSGDRYGFESKINSQDKINVVSGATFDIKIPKSARVIEARIDAYGQVNDRKYPKNIVIKKGSKELVKYAPPLNGVITLKDDKLKNALDTACSNPTCTTTLTVTYTDGKLTLQNLVVQYTDYTWNLPEMSQMPSGLYTFKVTPYDQFEEGDAKEVPFFLERGCTGGNADGTCDDNEDCSCIDCDKKQARCGDNQVCVFKVADVNSDYINFGCVCREGTSLCDDGTCNENCNRKGCGVGNGQVLVKTTDDGICGIGEGCGCPDCNGKQGSCAAGLVCDEKTKLCLECIYTMEGTVKDSLDTAVSGIDIKINPGDYPNIKSESDGKYKAKILLPGTYTVKAEGPANNGQRIFGSLNKEISFTKDECLTKTLDFAIEACNNCGNCPEKFGCDKNKICDSGTCKTPCNANSDCASSQVCIDGVCRFPGDSPCSNDGFCSSTETCACSDCVNKPSGCRSGLVCSETNGCDCNPYKDFFCDQTCADVDPDCTPTFTPTNQKAEFTVKAKNIVPITKIVTYKGQPIKVNIVVWDESENE